MGAGLSDALHLPLRGAQQGPAHFVAGVAAGASSLLLHVSHGALNSVSDFTSAVAVNLADVRADDAPAESTLPTTPRRTSPGGATSLLRGVGKGILGAVTKPVGGMLNLVSAASQSLIQHAAPLAAPPHALPPQSSHASSPHAGRWPQRRSSRRGRSGPTSAASRRCGCAASCSPRTSATGATCRTRQREPATRRPRAIPPPQVRACSPPARASQVSAAPLGAARDTQHVLLLSTTSLHVVSEAERTLLLSTPLHSVLRLERSLPSPRPAARERDGDSVPLAVFLCPIEAQRLRTASCMQYTLTARAHRVFVAAYESLQLAALSSLREPLFT